MGRALDEAVKKVASATVAALAPHDATPSAQRRHNNRR